MDDDWRKQQLKSRLFGSAAPTRMGRYIVLDSLGQGGMGSVLRAYDETLDRQIAVKVMHERVKGRHHKRILREAQALARLSHPNVVHVYECGEVDGQLFIAMELVSGQTLQAWQQAGRPWQECLDAYVQAGRGLAAAHAVGMIHRDFKPSNCIIDPEGRVRVLDFGLARHAGQTDDDESERGVDSSADDQDPVALSTSSSMLAKKLTATGSVLGTVAYMAPEQMRGQPVDERADQYSFCVSLHEALFGDRPGSSGLAGNIAQESGEYSASSSTSMTPDGQRVPRWLVRALGRGLSPNPEDRWPTMEALIDELQRHRRRRSLQWMGAGALVVGLAAIAAAGLAPSAPAAAASPCETAGQEVDPLWNDERRSQVRTAVLSGDAAYAQLTWVSVRGQLDQYSTALAGAYAGACEAMERHEQTRDDHQLRKACLDKRGGALHQTVELLGRADAQVVSRAVELAVALPSPEPCENLEALRRESLSTPPDQESEQLRAARDELAKARVLRTARKLAEARALVAPVVVDAETLGDPLLLAEARVIHGGLLADLGEHERASGQLQQALQTAIEQEALALAVEALSILIFVEGVDRALPDVALAFGVVAQALAERESDRLAKAKVLTVIGQAWAAKDDYPQAQAHLERALELLRQTVGHDHIALAEPLDSLGVALRHQNELDGALDKHRRALEIRTHWQGEHHPDTAHQLINLAVVLVARRELDEAREQLHQALKVLMPAPVRDLKTIAHARSTLGTVLVAQRDHAAAQRELTLAVEAMERLYSPKHPLVARIRTNLGLALRRDGKVGEAIEQYEQSLTILRTHESTPERQLQIVGLLEELVKLLDEEGRSREAQVYRAQLADPRVPPPAKLR